MQSIVDILRHSLKDTRGSADVRFERFAGSWIERPIFERFEYTVARYGNKIAVDDGVRCLTYRELMRVCMDLASRIDAQVPPRAPVGVMLPNCALVPIAALACLAVGRPRNEKIMAESGVKALLVDHASMETAKLDVDIPQIDITIAPDNGIENIKIAEIWCSCARTALLRLPVAKTGKLKSAACRSIRARSKTHCAAVATLRRLRWSPATMTRVSLRLLPTWFRSDRLLRPSSQI